MILGPNGMAALFSMERKNPVRLFVIRRVMS